MEDGQPDKGGEDPLALPPGFRFHPTDEELITHYLAKKVIDVGFVARAIGDADLNKCEPWELPRRAKMGEKEWYFFCVKDRKYPSGLRTNRATESGYWKATGKDKEIYRGKSLVGMKKTLVFYGGRAPKGEKTNWVMHEYRLEGKSSSSYRINIPKTNKNEWVICRVFHKSWGETKSMANPGCFANEVVLPPLTEGTTNSSKNIGSSVSGPAHVTCFSKVREAQKSQEQGSSDPANFLSRSLAMANPRGFFFSQTQHHLPASFCNKTQRPGPNDLGSSRYPGANNLGQLLESHGWCYDGTKQSSCNGISQETRLASDPNPEISSIVSNSELPGALEPDVDCSWSYLAAEEQKKEQTRRPHSF